MIILALIAFSTGLSFQDTGVGEPRHRAWGDDGHQIVCEIAWQYLTPTTRRAVRELLPQGEYGYLYTACTWPDRYARNRSYYDWLKPLHFVNVPIDASAYDMQTHCSNKECVVEAITRFAYELSNDSLPEWRRVNALRLLGHFVGDIHQPLHVSHPDNCGGCSAKPTFEGTAYRNMHKLWDSTLIERQIEQRYISSASNDIHSVYMLWEDYAFDLRLQIDEDDRKEWISTLDPADWADESLELAQSDRFEYTTGDAIPEDYLEKAIPVIEMRLKQAGTRLAALLNSIFDVA